MPTEQNSSPKPSNHDVRYEKTDAHVRPLYQFLFWISVITIVTAVFAWGVWKGVLSWRDASSTRPALAQPADTLPPSPRLQIREPKDLAAFRKEEDDILGTYGIVDKDKGVYRMPIEEAMKLAVERGLPSVAAAPQAAEKPAPAPAPVASAKPAASAKAAH
jgi:hypothetical protein